MLWREKAKGVLESLLFYHQFGITEYCDSLNRIKQKEM